jgi:hypothetical protein
MTKSPRDSQRLLRNALLCNALFSALSGLALVFAHNRIGTLLGLTENDSLPGLGVGLILFATALAFSARRSELKLPEARVAVALDFAWVLGSYVILFLVPFNPQGKWVIAAIADVVLAFGILQWVGIYRIRSFRQQREV